MPGSVQPVVYVLSDALGETGESVIRAAISQFYPTEVFIRRVPFIQNQESIDRAIQEATKSSAMIVFTLVIPELKNYLLEQAHLHKLICIDILGPIIDKLEMLIGTQSRHKPGVLHRLDEDYFKKIEAIEFAVKYDDGKDPKGILQADIVLVGISRTSKTPLSMYLATRAYKVANVPLVPEVQPPKELFIVSSNKVIGLISQPDHLSLIRSERLKSLGLSSNAMYANENRIKDELEQAIKIMKKINCHIIDVSKKAVEETASIIQDLIPLKL